METKELTMWSRIIDDPVFQGIPFKIETNENDQIILTAYKLYHSYYQGQITGMLRDLVHSDGHPAVEFAIATDKGVKVPDVVWVSNEVFDRVPDDLEASPVAPELCIEVLSRSNTKEEIAEKRQLYFGKGSLEVWTCDADGGMTFYDPEGEIETSVMAPDFPSQITL